MAFPGSPTLADPQIFGLPHGKPCRESAGGMALATPTQRNSGQRVFAYTLLILISILLLLIPLVGILIDAGWLFICSMVLPQISSGMCVGAGIMRQAYAG
ncbi:MAG TPA: hypothetical protein VE641_06640 [Chthoniobacterales bacterium]|nr:hypothetical protein [Chthoniobacterales bacterium]